MHVMFVCPGMPFNGDTIKSGKSLGGSETACYYLAKQVAALGNKVIVFTNQQDAGGNHDGVDYGWCGPPNQRAPLGEYVHSFMESTYIDALVLQRAAGIHQAPHCAKVALWWLHDLALLRSLPDVRRDSFYYDGVLTVSDWHRDQVADTWDMPKGFISVVRNSVDTSIYSRDSFFAELPKAEGEFRLLYQSRPERGVDYLLAPGGIMDRLSVSRPEARLVMCGYDNYPDHMKGYYEQVYTRANSMKNVTVIGHLGKSDLARLQESCDMLVYPSEFEETSCITAMEAQAAGLPMVGSRVGALSETCGAGARLIPMRDGRCDSAAFSDFIARVKPTELTHMRRGQLASATRLSWRDSAVSLMETIDAAVAKKQSNKFSMVRTMLDRSDVILARKFMDDVVGECGLPTMNVPGLQWEALELAAEFAFLENPDAHYDSDDAVADILRNESLDVTNNLRFQETARQLFAGGVTPENILDYGCQKGHYIWSMATNEKAPHYVGVDVSPRVIEWAREHCKVDGARIEFKTGEEFDRNEVLVTAVLPKFDGLVLGEVLEHVEDPIALCQKLEPYLMDGCRVVITTPFGDWEGKDYRSQPGHARYHLHHFERADLDDMFSHHDGYLTTCVPAGRSAREPLGSWVTSFVYRRKQNDPWGANKLSRPIDWDRKMRNFVPRQSISYCALAKDNEATQLRSLMTVRDVVDEFIIALDRTTTDRTRRVLEEFRDKHAGHRRFEIIDADSPLEIGFDEARNRTVEAARGDWILWLDGDEDLVYPERLIRYLRNNQYDGYALAQHHMSADPVGILTTDWPVRVFRNEQYLRFKGVVHEHPDDTENPNSGPRSPAQLVDLHILHHGYTTEPVRRARFQRNLPLIQEDRRRNPDRILGRMLWIRDLAHLCMFELERSGGRITDEMQRYALEGIREWELLLKDGDKPIAARMVRDSLEFYSTLVRVIGGGFEVEFQAHFAKHSKANLAAGPKRGGMFLTREHFDKYMKLCVDEQTMKFDSKYF